MWSQKCVSINKLGASKSSRELQKSGGSGDPPRKGDTYLPE